VANDRGGYEKSEYTEEENIKDDVWIGGVARNMENNK